MNKNKLKNFTKKISPIGLAITLTFSFSMSAYAQTFVQDNVLINVVKGSITGATTSINTTLTTLLLDVKNAINATRITQDLQMQNDNANIANADARMRSALGQAEIAKKDMEAMPTLEQCVELTGAIGRSSGGGSSQIAGHKIFKDGDKRAKSAYSTANTLANVVATRDSDKACDQNDVNNSAFCKTVGDFAGASKNSNSLDTNLSVSQSKNVVNGQKVQGANYTIPREGQPATISFIENTFIPRPPVNLKPEEFKANPTYKVLYDIVDGRLSVIRNAMGNIAKIRFENVTPNSAFSTYWAGVKSHYNEVFPNLTAPVNPSEYELLNLAVNRDYSYYNSFGSDLGTIKAEDAMKMMARTLTYTNEIALLQLNRTEDNNKLLALIASHMMMPITESQLSAESSNARTNKNK